MRRGDGYSLIELLMVVALIAIIAGIAIPGLLRARVAANEGAAIASLRMISSAQATFASSCGRGGFAHSLADLGLPPMGSTPFLPADLASGSKGGYDYVVLGTGGQVALAADTCNGAAGDTVTGFLATANPTVDGSTGERAFGVDNGGALRYTHDPAGITTVASYQAASVLQ